MKTILALFAVSLMACTSNTEEAVKSCDSIVIDSSAAVKTEMFSAVDTIKKDTVKSAEGNVINIKK